jgi:hypothetical protein
LLSNRRLDNPTALVLFGFASITVLNGPITLNILTASFGWLFAGLILAASTPANQFNAKPNSAQQSGHDASAPLIGEARPWPARP